MTPEFSRRERLDSIGERDRAVAVEADAEERAALALRFDLLALDRLAADWTIRRVAGGIAATGRVRAEATQACVATGEPVPTIIDEPVELRFVDEGTPAHDEVELDEADCDTMPIENGAIDLGEAAAETLALALDPFPRAPGAEAALRAAGVLSEEDAKPAGALAGLKEALEKR